MMMTLEQIGALKTSLELFTKIPAEEGAFLRTYNHEGKLTCLLDLPVAAESDEDMFFTVYEGNVDVKALSKAKIEINKRYGGNKDVNQNY